MTWFRNNLRLLLISFILLLGVTGVLGSFAYRAGRNLRSHPARNCWPILRKTM